MFKIVTIGGGDGQSCLLRALKSFLPRIEITAIVSVSDSGGSSGRLREKFQILPVGDLLRAVLSLSVYPYETSGGLREIFVANRFSSGEVQGHNLGNLLLTYLYQQSRDWTAAIQELSDILKIQGRVLPVTLDLTTLCAELENGTIVRGESKIDIPEHDCRLRKKRLWLEPPGRLLPEVKEALQAADFIILSPGDLYTSLIPNLLVEGMPEVLAQTKAKLIYIVNPANRQSGETCGFKASDYISEIYKHLSRKVDWLIVHDKSVLPNWEHFAAKKWEPVEIDEGPWQKDYQIVYHDLYSKEEAGLDWRQLIEPLGRILGLG